MKTINIIVLIVCSVLYFCGCNKYTTVRTGDNRRMKIKTSEYLNNQKEEEICNEIAGSLNITKQRDSLSEQLFLNERSKYPSAQVRHSLLTALDSLDEMIYQDFQERYANSDTLGSSVMFHAVFPEQMQRAIEKYAPFCDETHQLWIMFYKKSGNGYFYLFPGAGLVNDADGYALYDNRIQIAVYDKHNLAQKVVRISEMRRSPYYDFWPITNGGYAISYDGRIDKYRIISKNKIERVE